MVKGEPSPRVEKKGSVPVGGCPLEQESEVRGTHPWRCTHALFDCPAGNVRAPNQTCRRRAGSAWRREETRLASLSSLPTGPLESSRDTLICMGSDFSLIEKELGYLPTAPSFCQPQSLAREHGVRGVVRYAMLSDKGQGGSHGTVCSFPTQVSVRQSY